MDNAKFAETRQWLIKSQRDLKAAYVLLINNEESLLDAVVYHCQQAAEKALKAYLTYQEQVVKKTHDLDVLLDICSLFEPGFHDLKDIADTLTPYATDDTLKSYSSVTMFLLIAILGVFIQYSLFPWNHGCKFTPF